MEVLVNEICYALLDMDFADYAPEIENDLKALEEDLELLKEYGNGALLEAIRLLVE